MISTATLLCSVNGAIGFAYSDGLRDSCAERELWQAEARMNHARKRNRINCFFVLMGSLYESSVSGVITILPIKLNGISSCSEEIRYGHAKTIGSLFPGRGGQGQFTQDCSFESFLMRVRVIPLRTGTFQRKDGIESLTSIMGE